MSNWIAFIEQFPHDERHAAEQLVALLRTTLDIQNLEAIAELAPQELANVLALAVPDNPASDQDDRERLTLAKRMIKAARQVIAQDAAASVAPTPAVISRTPSLPASRRPRHVHGRVLSEDLEPQPRVTVRAFDRDLRHDEPLGEGVTGDDGRYRIEYEPIAEVAEGRAPADLIVRAYQRRGKGDVVIASSRVRFHAGVSEYIDVIAGEEDWSEFERIVRLVTPALDGAAITDLLQADVDFLARDTGFDAVRIGFLVIAHRMAAITKLPPRPFYDHLTASRLNGAAALDRFWRSVNVESAFTVEQGDLFRLAALAGDDVRYDLPLVEALIALWRTRQVFAPIDLAIWTAADWIELLDRTWSGKVPVPAWAVGDNRDASLAYAAEWIIGRTAQVFSPSSVRRRMITGRVVTSSQRAAVGVRLQAFHITFDGAVPISAPVRTRGDGSYQIVIDAYLLRRVLTANGRLPLQLRLEATTAAGEDAGRSDIESEIGLPLDVDIQLQREIAPTEFELVGRRISEALGGGNPVDVARDKLTWLAGAARVDLETASRFVAAHQSAVANAPISAAVFYGLDHAAVKAAAGTGASAEAKLQIAVTAGIVGADVLAHAATAAGVIAKAAALARAAEIETRAPAGARPRPADILDAIGVAPKNVTAYAKTMAARTGTDTAAIRTIVSEARLPTDVQHTIRRGFRLAELVGFDPPLIGTLMPEIEAAERPRSRGAEVEDDVAVLAGLNADDWANRLKQAAPDADPQQRRRRARAIESAFERVFPHDAALGGLRAVKGAANGTNIDALATIIQNKKIDLRGKAIKYQALDKVSAEVTTGLGKLQRLARVASFGDAALLLTQGYGSSRQIASTSRASFVRKYTSARLPTGLSPEDAKAETAVLKEHAQAIHRRAQRQAAAAMAVTMALSPEYHFAAPAFSRSAWRGGREVPDDMRATLVGLFGAHDACSVPSCQSVLGLPAYLVDLLELIDDAELDANPIEVLKGRRPDLLEMELSCANAETLLPYVDLAIELLERTVGKTAGSPYPQTTWAADELSAMPEHLSDAAYERLATEVYPWNLPFSLAHVEADTYLADLGSSRDELMRTTRRRTADGWADDEAVQIATAFLKIHPETRDVICGVTFANEPWKCWGYQAHPGRFPEVLSEDVHDLLSRGGLAVVDLLELIESDFINPIDTGSGTRRAKLVYGADACDLHAALIKGADARFYDRFHRFVRLWRALGWTIREIDRAIAVFKATDLTEPLLVEIAAAARLAARLHLPIETVLAFWGDLDTTAPIDRGTAQLKRGPSHYDRLFQDRGRLSVQQRAALSIPFAAAAQPDTTRAVAAAVLGLAPTDLAVLTGGDNALGIDAPAALGAATSHLSIVSHLHRWHTLAVAIDLPMRELLRFTAITAIDPFSSVGAASQLIDALDLAKTNNFSIDDLDFLLRHTSSTERRSRFEDEAKQLLTRVTSAVYAPGLTRSRDEICRALERVLTGAGRDSAARIVDVLEGTGMCKTAFTDTAIADADAIGLATGEALLVKDVRERLQPIVAAIGGSVDDYVKPLSLKASPGGVDSAAYPGTARNNVLLDNDRVSAALVAPVLAAEIASAYGLADDTVLLLVDQIRDGQVPILHAAARAVRMGTVTGANWDAFVRLAKTAWLFGRLDLSADDLKAGAGTPQSPLSLFPARLVPTTAVAAPPSSTAGSLFDRWAALGDLADLKRRIEAAGASLWSVRALAEGTAVESWAVVLHAAGRPTPNVTELIGPTLLNITTTAPASVPWIWLRMLDAADAAARVGAPTEALPLWASDTLADRTATPPIPAASTAAAIRNAAAARRGGQRWRQIAPQLRGGIRVRQRDALIACAIGDCGVKDAGELQGHYLVDVAMGPDQLTTRLGLATAAVQRFVQRTMLGSEKDAADQTIGMPEDFEDTWAWMKSYRTWRESRKIFLYPENFIEPETRDDKSPFFLELERTLSQRELTDQTIDDAIGAYLQALTEVAKLEITGTCLEKAGDDQLLHIVARTRGVPQRYFHRTWNASTQAFTAWAPLDLDIEGDWVVPAVLDGRLHLYWIKHTKQLEGMTDTLGFVTSRPFPLTPHYPMYQDQYALSWSTRHRKGWSKKKTADHYIARPFFPLGPASFAVRPDGDRLRIGGVTLLPQPPPTLGGIKQGNAGVMAVTVRLGNNRVTVNRSGASVETDHGSASAGTSGVQVSTPAGSAGFDANGNPFVNPNPGFGLTFPFSTENPPQVPGLNLQPLIDELLKIKGAIEGLGTTVGNLSTNLPGEIWNHLPDNLREAIEFLSAQAGAFRQTIDAVWGLVNPPNTLPERIASNIVKLGAEFVVVLGRALEEVLKAVRDSAMSGGALISSTFGEQMQRLINDVLQFRPGWSGPVPGFEFGFFDVSESGAKAVRLAPPPNFAPPLGLEAIGAAAVSWALSNLMAGLAALNEAGRLLYSLFPGYPGLYDVPVLSGVLSTDLPLMQGSAKDDAMVKAWPGSGYFLVFNESLLEMPSYCSVMINIGEIAKDEATELADSLAQVSGGREGPFGAMQKLLGGATTMATLLSEKVENVASLLNVGMRVVRPVPFGPFPGRLHVPPPTIISEDRRGRVFMMLRGYHPQERRPIWVPVSLYHPLAATLSRAYDRDGVVAVYKSGAHPDGAAWKHGDDSPQQKAAREAFYKSFAVLDPALQPDQSGVVLTPLSGERLEFSPRGSYSIYNWELFFHVPMLLASRHATQQAFDRAIAWYRHIFDPTVSSGAAPQRYWRFKHFHDEFNASNSLTAWLRALADGSDNHDQAAIVAQWRRDPFNPHRVARLRAGAYERAVVMRTVETLINWGDARFREGTWETVNEATQLYLMAGEILGERPKLVPFTPPAAKTYSGLKQAALAQDGDIDGFGNALLTVESALGEDIDEADSDPSGRLVVLSGGSMLYFGVPVNDRLLHFWDLVDDRLYKIRHSLDIRGKARSRYPDGIGLEEGGVTDPTIGVSEAAAGTLATVPLPAYRFQIMVQKANEFAGDVRAMGSAVLSAMEKRDGEALARLRAGHEITLLQAARRVRELQVEEAQHALNAAEQGREGAKIRHRYYTSREFINAAEGIKEGLFVLSSGLQLVSGGLELSAAVMHALPDISVGAGGHGNSPHATISYGSNQLGNAVSAAARAASLMSSVAQIGSTMAGTMATYQRRQEEWDQQAELAENDIEQFAHQIDGASARLRVAARELENQRKQIAHSKEVAEFMQEKFTNQELYEWMLGEVSAVHFQAYLLAVDMARRAEACYRFERAPEEPAFIRVEPWHGLAAGLMAGERLQQNLRRMEAAFLERNTREHELTKQVSLALLDPVALLMLQQKGECYVDLPERIFDGDHPGHYLRRLKTVSLSIPCVAGPYTSINCRLTLVNSSIRMTPEVPPNYADRAALKPMAASISTIATSTGQSDGGVFELNLKDERYLPFEGAGAISAWRLELPHQTNRFDFASISDVILHVRYTARDGGTQLREAAWQATFNATPPDPIRRLPPPSATQRMFSVRRDFGDAWYRFLSPADTQQDLVLDLNLSPAHFGYAAGGAEPRLKTMKIVLLTGAASTGLGLKARLAKAGDGNAAPVPAAPDVQTFNVDTSLAGLRTATFDLPAGADTGSWSLEISRADNPGTAGNLLQPGPVPAAVRIDRSQIEDVVVICSLS